MPQHSTASKIGLTGHTTLFANDKNSTHEGNIFSEIIKTLYLHLNVSSSPYHCDEFSVLINNLKMKLKTVGIFYSRTRTPSIQY